MFNPRHSFISTSSATTYPSTLSPPKSVNKPLSSPTSPRHSSRLHRSSKRNLRTSASTNALRSIAEDAKARTQTQLRPAPDVSVHQDDRTVRPTSANSLPAATNGATPRSRSQNVVPVRPTSRTSSADTVKAWAQNVRTEQSSTPQPVRSTSTVPSSSTVKPKSSRDQLAAATIRPASTLSDSLKLDAGIPARQPSKNSVKRDPRVAQPRKPEPINVNPGKTESMADEWEKELIQSAKNLRFEPTQAEKGKSKEVQNVLEWERSGRWQAEVDPTREMEDRQRRDAGREIGKSALLTVCIITR